MAPSKIEEYTEVDNHSAELAAFKAKVASNGTAMNGPAHPPPVADDYMYDFKYNHHLPTTDTLGVAFPTGCDAQAEASGIIEGLSDALGAGDADAFAEMFLEYGKIHAKPYLNKRLY